MHPEPSQPEPPNALKVFIVEDSINMQVALKDLVCAVTDAEIVGVAASEAMALDWASSHAGRWDLAIVDLTLEQGDGFNIVRRLKAEETGAVVVFSAFVTDVIRRHCESLGANAVFHKTESAGLARYVEDLAGSPLPS
jgi:two-component system, OmpR family, response regulator